VVDPIDSLRPALVHVLDQLELPNGDKPVDGLLEYLALLQRWNSTYNLTSVRDPRQMLIQHLADCLGVVAPLQRKTAGMENVRLLDVGSGGGLPGAVIALLMPQVAVTCIDAVGKKAAFVQQVASRLKLSNLTSKHARVEQLAGEPFGVITSRAFASLVDFIMLSRSQLKPGGIWLAMKGRHPADEIATLPSDIDLFHVEQLSIPGLKAERCLIWMRRNA
jgi:16S rRNA (guanine527-N7)-methyltransferase